MNRILLTDPFARPPVQIGDDMLVITPHRSAAAALGRPYYSLPRLAQKVLRERTGLVAAPDIYARHKLKRTVARHLPGKDASAIAARNRAILETVLRTGIDIDRMIEAGSKRVRKLGEIARDYRDELRRENFVDRSELLLAAATAGPERLPLIVYGHHRARKEEAEFIDAIAGDGSIFYLPCGEHDLFTANCRMADELVAKGWQRVETTEVPASAGGRLAARFAGVSDAACSADAFRFANVEEEVRGVLARVKRLVSAGAAPHAVALLCRDQRAYGPVIASVAGEYNLPVRMEFGVPLSETLFGGFVGRMFDAIRDEYAYESTARWLMHPLGPGLPDGGWTAARASHAAEHSAWAELFADLPQIDTDATKPLREWIAVLEEIFAKLGVRRRAAERARETLACECFFDALRSVSRLEAVKSIGFEQFSAIVLEVLYDESVPFVTGSAGVTLFDMNTALGASFDHLFVLGMAEGVLPAPATENPVIDFHERKQLLAKGIEFEDAAAVARWESLSFYLALLSARESVTFSYPATVDGKERIANAFFGMLGLEPTEPEEHFAASLEEQRASLLVSEQTPDGLLPDPIIEDAQRRFHVELARETLPVYDEFDGITGIGLDHTTRLWSASQLTAFGQCSFRWFAARILRLAEVEEAELGMDYTKRGTFYHAVLERAVEKAKDADDIRAATLEHLEASFIETENDPEVPLPQQSNWELQRAGHLTTLRKAVEAEDFIKEGARVVGIEREFNAEWQGFRIRGFIDRIDDTPDGLLAIDYKTSSVAPKGAKDADGKLKLDVQIPLYSTVALAELYPEGNLGNSLYYSLVKGTILKQQKDPTADMAALEGLAATIRERLAAGKFPVDPDAQLAACTYCDLDLVCRKGPRLHRKTTD